MKKVFAALLVALLCLSGCSFRGCSFLGKKTETNIQETQKKIPPPKQVALKFSEDNPYVYLVPRADGLAVNLYATRFGEAKYLGYELLYKTETQLQKAIGRFDLKGEEVGPEEILFGTCSAGGKCTFDKGVEEGTLTLKFLYQDIREEKVWESDFHLQTITGGGGEISSKDGKFTFKIPTGGISGPGLVNTMPFLSFPDSLGKKIEGEVYGVFPVPGMKIIKGTVSFLFFSLPENFDQLAIFGWNGNEWTEYKTTSNLADKTLSALVEGGTVFAVAAP